MTTTHGSLFSGIGGFDLGFDRAGIKTRYRLLGNAVAVPVAAELGKRIAHLLEAVPA